MSSNNIKNRKATCAIIYNHGSQKERMNTKMILTCVTYIRRLKKSDLRYLLKICFIELTRHFYGMNDLADDLICIAAFHFFFRAKRDAMTEHGRRDINDIIRRYKIAAAHGCQRFCAIHDTDGCAW